MIAISCPACQNEEKVIRFGINRSGTPRCRCKACGKTYTLSPKSQSITDEKEQAIFGALAERISQRGIARSLKVSRFTIRNLRKKRTANRRVVGASRDGNRACQNPMLLR